MPVRSPIWVVYLYSNGQGVERSYEKAREWFMKSAEQGNENAIKGSKCLTNKKEEQLTLVHSKAQ